MSKNQNPIQDSNQNPNQDSNQDSNQSFNQDPNPDKTMRDAIATAGIALSIPSSFVGPILLGYWLDKYFNTKPVIFIIGFLLGCFAVVVEVKLLMKKAE